MIIRSFYCRNEKEVQAIKKLLAEMRAKGTKNESDETSHSRL